MPAKRIAYNLFGQSVLLLVFYMGVALLTAVKFLASDPLVLAVPYQHSSGFANILLHLAILTGVLGTGVYFSEKTEETLLRRTFEGWSIFLVAAFLAGLLGITEGRPMLELPLLLDAVQVILTVLFVVAIAVGQRQWSSARVVWITGIGLNVLCTLLSLLTSSDVLRDNVLRAFAVGLNFNVAYLLCALAVGYWLMGRFSTIGYEWVENRLYVNAGLLVTAGVIITIATVSGISAGIGGTLFVLVAYGILVAHSYRALSFRSPVQSAAPHWYILSVGLLLFGAVLGALSCVPEISRWTQGTRLTDLQLTLTALGIIAMLFGLYNEARRIWLLPYWFIVGGTLVGGVALAGAGLVQVYMERVLGIGYLDTQTYLIPLYVVWIVGLLILALGIGFYALGLWLQRKNIVT